MPAIVVAVWAASVPALALVGALLRSRIDLPLLAGADPFVGHWMVRAGPGVVAASRSLALVVRYELGLAARLSWKALVCSPRGAAAVFWTVKLAVTMTRYDLVQPGHRRARANICTNSNSCPWKGSSTPPTPLAGPASAGMYVIL